MIKDINFQMQNYHNHTIRNINKYSMTEFQIKLSHESWDDLFVMIITKMLIPFLNEKLIIIHGLQHAQKSVVFKK